MPRTAHHVMAIVINWGALIGREKNFGLSRILGGGTKVLVSAPPAHQEIWGAKDCSIEKRECKTFENSMILAIEGILAALQ